MIVVTGAAGFIGSNLLLGLNALGINDIIAVDDLVEGDKFQNLVQADIAHYMDKDEFRQRILNRTLPKIQAVLHQGACSDTTERDGRFMMDNNYQVSLELLEYCQSINVPFIYASSAAVYGAGPHYTEDVANERPLNVYGYSKFLFDQVVRKRFSDFSAPVVGLRYFNVYGPQENHKGRMASVALHNMNQYQAEGVVRLFGGWDGYPDGGQQRDFVYIDDVVAVNLHFLQQQVSGIFNCGSGQAQPFNDVAHTVVNTLRELDGLGALSLEQMVSEQLLQYIDFPDDLKGRYQSHTQADLTQLRAAGYEAEFSTVQQGVRDYVLKLRQK